jgi:two-component system alkaline phosphatase synthesis response regulator PhoP
MSGENILVVDDEEDIRELVRHHLVKEGYGVTGVGSGEETLPRARKLRPDLIVLDLMLPGIDGLTVCKQLKQDESLRGIPVIMLTAKGTEADVVTGLELGADDYVTKPFSPRVLVARIRSVLRRRREGGDGASSGELRRGPLVISPGRHQVLRDGKPVDLTATEFSILSLLAQRPGWVFTRNQIIEGVRGEEYPVTDRSVDVHITGLRRKLEAAGDLIETVRGVGYRFRE